MFVWMLMLHREFPPRPACCLIWSTPCISNRICPSIPKA